ncbi:MAG TPA: hypothetical protein VFS61_10870 [Anaerolineales bacterium]|nr:hypothetical protein [Anaerolineales bacterium]
MNTIQFFTDKECFPACDAMDIPHRPAGADLFELQMFMVDIGNGQKAWYGSLQRMDNGEKHYFKGWSGLAANLQGILTPSAQLEVLKTLVLL